MAVAKWQDASGNWSHMRNFHPPKRADLKYWYREAAKALGSRIGVPTWEEAHRTRAAIDTETIIFELSYGTLYIARKQFLR